MLNFKNLSAISITFSLILSLAPYSAHANDKQTFNTAYIKYQSAARSSDWDAALPQAKTAYELGVALYQDTPETRAQLAANYGTALLNTGSHTSALLKFEEALSIFESSYGKDAPELASLLMNMSEIQAKTSQQLATALQLQARAESIVKSEYGSKSVEHADHLMKVGLILTETAETERAARAFLKAQKYYANELGDGAYELARANFYFAKQQLFTKNTSKARKYFQETIATLEKRGDSQDFLLKDAQSYLIDLDSEYKAVVAGE